MSARNDNNVYKPKVTGFLIACIFLVLLVIVVLGSTVILLSRRSGAPAQTDAPSKTDAPILSSGDTTTLSPAVTDETPTTTTPEGTDTPVTPTNPTRVPTKVAPTESTLSLPLSAMNSGSLLLLDADHPYQVDMELMLGRAQMSQLSDAELAETYGFSRVAATSPNYKLSSLHTFMKSDALYYFDEMMADYVKETSHTDVQLLYGYYCEKTSNIESIEHSTGYYIDLQVHRTEGTYPLNYELFKSEYYDWFVENCWKYGFVHVRDKNNYTTFRFMGAAHTAAMNKYGFGLSEYLSAITVYSKDNFLRITDGFGWEWRVYYVQATGDTTAVPVMGTEDSYDVSGNNLNGYIVAINTACFS